MDRKMQIGDRVKVYTDPITETDAEGEAMLLNEKRIDEFNGLALWLVHFVNDPDGEVYRRWIKYREIDV